MKELEQRLSHKFFGAKNTDYEAVRNKENSGILE